MNAGRYAVLVGSLLEDGALAPAEADELAALIAEHPGLRADLRRQLVLWELWSQQLAPERGAESFLAACRTRLRADSETEQESFVATVHRRLKKETTRRRPWFGLPRALAWAAPLALLAIAVLVWSLLPRPLTAGTLEGEAICTACMLHESREHRPVLRIHDGDTTRLCYLESDRPLHPQIGDFCSAPVPVHVTGPVRTEQGRLVLAVRALKRVAPPPDTVRGPDDSAPILFPF